MASDKETRLSIRLPADLYEAVAFMAKREERTISGQITYLLREALDIPNPEAVERRQIVSGNLRVELGGPSADD